MAEQQSWKELIAELDKHKAEVSKLKRALNELDIEKESWFKKREEFSKKIREYIQKIKGNREKRDALAKEIKELKPKRGSINSSIFIKSKDLENLKKEKIGLANSLGIKETPSKIRHDIENLEFKIETSAMPFDKERELMKRIKGLKKLYSAASAVNGFNEKIKAAGDEIRKMRSSANDTHRSIQEKAGQAQALHQEILDISAEADKIKVEEESAFKKFSDLKAKFNEANAQLKEKLKTMDGIRNSLDSISSERKERKRMRQESFLRSKEDEVNEKIKRGEKLTTEDLLVFQEFGNR